MGQQAVKTGPDAERAEYVVADGQPQHAPPTKKVGDEGQRNQQMKETDAEHVRPDDAALRIHLRRARNVSPQGRRGHELVELAARCSVVLDGEMCGQQRRIGPLLRLSGRRHELRQSRR
jgi:hypothetical protein